MSNNNNNETPVINLDALEPLFTKWEEPKAHRVRAKEAGKSAEVVKGRRSSPITIAQKLRAAVRDWREAFYAGASDTTRQLLGHWFERPHRVISLSGEEFEFRYYFCQREAIETLIYLKEVRGLHALSQIVAEYGGADAEIAALGVTEDEDAWSRYAIKLATGTGKTKVMSLAVVWSYFHALRESESEMARHFVVVAPNLTVYERLKEDFGDGKIFDSDPLIPPEWRGDWNMSTVLQDEACGAATGGTLYLTNIHRLYDTSKRKKKKEEETYDWMGPAVSKASALDTGQALRDRITSHERVMVLNDEAHHVWDPDSAWNEAIQFLHETIKARTGGNLVAQLDFTATPKDNKGQPFKHIVCDAPLGEAVDAGIVKTPVIGKADKSLRREVSDDAAYEYDRHLRLGYERWKRSREEWLKSGKKALLFVMCEDTKAADQITKRFNTDETFKELNGKTINLHTNLKGKLKKIGKGADARVEFVEDEKQIKDEDLKVLRELSRRLDENTSPYLCIVSVLMLREGWDVRNVTTIVPLRPYTSTANILPEQTLGRGLRRMTPPGQATEVVTVVEHPAFASLYQEELAQQGLPLEIIELDRVPSTTISIYPDESRKDFKVLEIELPALTTAHRTLPKLDGLTKNDIKKEFKKYRILPLGKETETKIEYEGRHLFTGEVIEKMKINLPLLDSGVGAISYYVKQLENICKVRGLHSTLAPLVQYFLEEVLFEEKTNLFDQRLISRLADSDVGEHLRAVFVPLIRAKTTSTEERISCGGGAKLSLWRPFQVTHSERRPAKEAKKTLFNLVPCNRELEVAMAMYADRATDVVAFAKNAGPQSLRIDYIGSAGRISFYTPDFFMRTKEGNNYLIESKGREDKDVPRKAKAAIAWCESATESGDNWEYVYVPQGVFERLTGNTIDELVRTCRPALQNLLETEDAESNYPLFAGIGKEDEKAPDVSELFDVEILQGLPNRYKKGIEQATTLYKFFENKEEANFAPVFTPLLGLVDDAAKNTIVRRLQVYVPTRSQDQKAWFTPYLSSIEGGKRRHYESMAQNLKRTLVFESGRFPLGLLRSCLDFALNDKGKYEGVFDAVREGFKTKGARDLLDKVTKINDFRNNYIAHQEKELIDPNLAKEALIKWIDGIKLLATSEGTDSTGPMKTQ